MSIDEVEAAVIELLGELQHLSGRPGRELTPSSEPIGDLDGFDSLAAIEATVYLEKKLGCEVECDSLFVADGRSLTITQVAARVLHELEAKR